ncbi:hypothetical protein [Novosphingobium naphthalenivorans]|uniref:hypothetical protein n=1 Tax=Novosphingobium naphthalenivorans TaxID=273168 RepID=UPI00082DE4FC|nr:hypothetical protein [Novosphingobium naphthalenivorans]
MNIDQPWAAWINWTAAIGRCCERGEWKERWGLPLIGSGQTFAAEAIDRVSQCASHVTAGDTICLQAELIQFIGSAAPFKGGKRRKRRRQLFGVTTKCSFKDIFPRLGAERRNVIREDWTARNPRVQYFDIQIVSLWKR